MVLLSKSIATIAALLPVITGVFASPAAEPAHLEKRQGFVPVTGVTGGVSPRLELSTLQASNPTQWNLFLIALQRFQDMSQNDRQSWFQISGIHGAPYVTWDNIGPGANGNSRTGYCPHSSNIFGPWHRPYLALFEQILVRNANDYVNTLPAGATRDTWAAAARTLRLPYLDWARPLGTGQQVLPPSLTSSQVSVRYADGTTRSVRNPLFDYQFRPPHNDFGATWVRWQRTVRSPPNSGDPNGQSNHVAINANLLRMRPNMRQYVYNILTQYQSFNQFSNTGSQQSGRGTLEGIHDSIHSTIGGHMGIVSIAAFDPLFWLHHCNVDRLMTLFQALYPQTYVTTFRNARSTYTIAANSLADGNSALTPFRTTQNQWWTSNTARSAASFGYTYPELQDNPSNSTLRTRINSLYQPGATNLVARGAASLEADPLDRRAPTPRVYLLELEAPASLGGTYDIDIFFGNPTTTPENYKLDPNFVGVQGLLAKIGATNNEIVYGTVPLTVALDAKKKSGALKADSHRAVLRYLRDNLKWRIERDGAEIPTDQVPNLKVTVTSAIVKPAQSADEFPQWGPIQDHPEVTEGKNGS